MTRDGDGIFRVSYVKSTNLSKEVYADHHVNKSAVKYFPFFYYMIVDICASN